jgi:hypothetical protein
MFQFGTALIGPARMARTPDIEHMATKKSSGDARYTKVVGEQPNTGRRYVENGKVRIQWTEGGKRRSRTIGPNSPANRKRADEELEEILSTMNATEEKPESKPLDVGEIEQKLRDYALSALDKADEIADWIRDAIARGPEPEGEEEGEAEVVEEAEEESE